MRDCFGAAWTRATGRVGSPAPVLVPAFVPALVLGLMLAGCADDTQSAPAPAPVATATAAAPAPAATPPAAAPATSPDNAAADTASSGAVLANDPSAPANTPLCGIADRERNDLSRQLLPRRYAEAGQCSTFACYDAATATYIGADGYRHVCR